MDDLEFRRTLYADPQSTDRALLESMAKDPHKQEFAHELRKLNRELQAAASVPVPEDLAHKLILRQSLKSHAEKQNRKNRWYMAIAASLAFVFGVSLTLFWQQPVVNLGENALAHVYHESASLSASSQALSLAEVNAKLASMDASLSASLNADIGDIIAANYCHFDKVKSLHLVVQNAQGKVSIFVIPQRQGHQLQQDFGDEKLLGKGLRYQQANVLIVGEKNQDIQQLQHKIRQGLRFSA